jgi:hypothetical protein
MSRKPVKKSLPTKKLKAKGLFAKLFSRKYDPRSRRGPDQKVIKQLEANIKRSKQKSLGWVPYGKSGRVYLSEQFVKAFLGGPVIIESVVVLVEHIESDGVHLSLQTLDKDGNWLTRMYCWKIAIGNSVTIQEYPRLMTVQLSGFEERPNNFGDEKK